MLMGGSMIRILGQLRGLRSFRLRFLEEEGESSSATTTTTTTMTTTTTTTTNTTTTVPPQNLAKLRAMEEVFQEFVYRPRNDTTYAGMDAAAKKMTESGGKFQAGFRKKVVRKLGL